MEISILEGWPQLRGSNVVEVDVETLVLGVILLDESFYQMFTGGVASCLATLCSTTGSWL